jgi:hypothetical protein
MGVYLRGRTYWFKRMIDGRVYARSLNIRKGQELLLSETVKLMDLEITDLNTTSRYTHPQLAEIQAAVSKLGTTLPGYDLEKVNNKLTI